VEIFLTITNAIKSADMSHAQNSSWKTWREQIT